MVGERWRAWLTRDDERGAALVLSAVVLGVVVLAMMLVVVGAEARVRVAQTQWAADAAARAAASELVAGRPDGGAAARRAAGRVAEANGARLASIEVVHPVTGAERVIRAAADDGPMMGRDPEAGPPIPISPTVVVEVSMGRFTANAGAARFAVVEP